MIARQGERGDSPRDQISVIKALDDRVRVAAKIAEDKKHRMAVYRGESGLIDHYPKINACLGLRCVRGELKQGGLVF